MGVAIENANGITKAYGENQDSLVKTAVNTSMRISQIENVQYKISYIMASSFTGKKLVQKEEGSEDLYQEPLDAEVTMNLTLNQYPHHQNTKVKKSIKFSANGGKFLQFAKDMRDAIELMENVKANF